MVGSVESMSSSYFLSCFFFGLTLGSPSTSISSYRSILFPSFTRGAMCPCGNH